MKTRGTIFFLLVANILSLQSCKNDDRIVEPHSCDELEGLTVSVMEGSVQADYASTELKDKNIDLKYFSSMTDCLLAVNQGIADVSFSNNLQIYNDDFKRLGLNVCHLVDEIKGNISFGISKENDALLAELNEAIDRYYEDGTIEDASNRWFDTGNTDFHNCIVIDPCPSDPRGGKPVLKVGTSGVKQPAEVLIDNKWTGFEIELLQRFAIEKGYELQILIFDFHNLIPALQSGSIDIASATLIISPERQEKINFCRSTHEVKTAFIVRGNGNADVPFWKKVKGSAKSSLIMESRWKIIIQGLWTTILITVLSLIFGAVLGAVLCMMRLSGKKALNDFARFYLYIMRNIPMLVFLMLMFYVFLAQTGLKPVPVAIIAFSMNSAAFISEIFRTGILSVDNGQVEAGRGIGCSAFQTFIHIVAPQAIKKILPVFKNECITLLKSTSVVGYISIIDLTKGSDLIRSASFEAFFPLIIITIFYFILATVITFAIDRILSGI